MCLSMGNVERGAWVSPRGEPRRWPLARFFRGNMLARGLEGSSTSRDEGPSTRGGLSLHGGEGHPCAFRWATSGGGHG